MSQLKPAKTLLLLVILLILAAAVLWLADRNGGGVPTLTADEAAQAKQQAREALAHLENERHEQATPLFRELADQLPNEPIVVRNLAISRLIEIEGNDAAEAIDFTSFEVDCQRLRDAEPDSGLTDWLIGRGKLKLASLATDPTVRATETAEAVASLSRAVELAADNVVFCHDLYDAVRYSNEPEYQQIARTAIQQAHAARPRNLFLLDALIQVQAASEDDQIITSLRMLRDLIGPLGPGIKRRNRGLDIVQLIDESIEVAETGDWTQIAGRVRGPGNFIRPDEVVRSDMRRVKGVSPLEFVATEFSAGFLEQYPPTPRDASLSSNFQFEAIESTGQLSEVTAVTAVAFADLDLDTTLDLIVLNDEAIQVFHAANDEWTLASRFDLPGDYLGVLVADLDRDEQDSSSDKSPCYVADADLVLYGPDGLLPLRNNVDESGMRTWEAVEQSPELQSLSNVRAAVLVDFDHDGDLDVVAATDEGLSLWSNLENFTFESLTDYSVLPPAGTQVDSLVAVDWERDVDIDVIVAGKGMASAGYLENLRHGEMRWVEFTDSFDALSASSTVAVVETDGNVSWDLLSASDRGVDVVTTRTTLGKSVSRTSHQQASTSPTQGIQACDLNNDGSQDLVAWSDQAVSVLAGRGDGTFAEGRVIDEGLTEVSTAVAADFDGDADLDLAVVSGGSVRLFRNAGDNGSALRLQVHGITDTKIGRVNHMGIGSLVEVKSGDRYQAQTVTSQTTHFGIGSAEQASIARVLFTNGIPQAVIDPAQNQSVCEKMRPKGSCPYVYTWTGERFEFFTDLLWAAPIGLQLADGVLANDRPWEYLLIPGESLQQKDGKYSLQITEELWEAAYFDQVELIAVDHPVEFEIYSNEKVGPPDIAEFKIHTVQERRTPVAARDRHGKDVLSVVRSRDENYLRNWDANLRQGVVQDHYLELDLGKLDDPQQITLFLTGWIYPTDTSLNVALSHNPLVNNPRPPYVLVPDADGNWQEVIPFMGFPGGKTKTIAVDLSQAFLTNDYRVRIATSHEIYWDEAFFTVNEEPGDVRLTHLKPVSADLHYRGFSREFRRSLNSPHVYDYDQLTAAPAWPPMAGSFTRFGDVKDLLLETDDRMVVMGAGDEITVTFAVPDNEPPDGWKRDFILHNVGWDKDADLNTVHGQSVEPLPFVGMKSYPPPLGGRYPQSPQHVEYLNRYQTRKQTPAAFWQLIQQHVSDSSDDAR